MCLQNDNSEAKNFTLIWQVPPKMLLGWNFLKKNRRLCLPRFVPSPLWWVDSKRRLAEAGVRVIFRDPERQRVPRAGGHGGDHGGRFGLHGNQWAPGWDGGAVSLLWKRRRQKHKDESLTCGRWGIGMEKLQTCTTFLRNTFTQGVSFANPKYLCDELHESNRYEWPRWEKNTHDICWNTAGDATERKK